MTYRLHWLPAPTPTVTSKQRASQKRPWLREEQLIVSRTLRDVLKVSRDYTDAEKLLICRLFHSIVMTEPSWGEYRNVGSDTFKAIAGPGYRRFVDWMIGICIKENPKYSAGSFSKSFGILNLTETNKATELVVLKYTVDRFTSPKDNSHPTDEVSRYVLQCLQQLTVREKLVPNPVPYRGAMALHSCKQIYAGCFNLSYGKNSRRLSHAVIRMVSEGRNNLILKDTGEDLVYCDIRSCFPSLLTLWITDAGERQRYVSALEQDIYTQVLKDTGSKWTRNKCKTAFSKTLSDPKHRGDNPVTRWLSQCFPILWSWIVSQSSLALMLQNTEAQIVVETLGKAAMRKRLWYVPMHDGFLCRQQDQQQLVQALKNTFQKQVQYTPELSINVLGTS
jgi:hypothetical protein